MNRILVIDDDAGNRLIVKSRLSDLGYEVITTETGASGLMEARGVQLDLVLVASSIDTGISSKEVCRRLKAMPDSAQVPVVLYSNQAPNPEEMSRAFEAGCDGFVNKQEMTVLDQIVGVHLKQKATVDEIIEQNQMLDQQYRRLRDGQEKPAEQPQHTPSFEGETRDLLRELASSKTDGLLLVDPWYSYQPSDRCPATQCVPTECMSGNCNSTVVALTGGEDAVYAVSRAVAATTAGCAPQA